LIDLLHPNYKSLAPGVIVQGDLPCNQVAVTCTFTSSFSGGPAFLLEAGSIRWFGVVSGRVHGKNCNKVDRLTEKKWAIALNAALITEKKEG